MPSPATELLTGIAFVVLIVSIPALVVRQLLRAMRRRRRVREESPAVLVHGFPVISEDPPPRPVTAIADAGPGRYRIIGVVSSTGTDTKMYIDAESLANAKVKAELRGVIVTDIAKA